jgi:hypothetical protein
MGYRKGAYRVLVGRREGKRSLERTCHRLQDNATVDIQEAVWESMDWIDVV